MKVFKQSLVDYSVENEDRKVMAWIQKSKGGYKVKFRNIFNEFDAPHFLGNFKEAKDFALKFVD